ncbi:MULTISPECIES: hypothetical protein [Lysinibacillus]|uniref:hypothetical protein n=1 Tax=Lysinibacillus TaxID=400634 RepID=UPI0008250870|nr:MULTISPECIES: hypothetical protein [Lysinibacillus]MEC1305976.1 hypothetical protein [Lysinibacillus capsici]OCX64127.1 hypothetical protein BFM98_11725 [Lysinibacillus sp. AR18-8]
MAEKIKMIAVIEVDEKIAKDHNYNIEEEFKWLVDSGISLRNLVSVPPDFDINDYLQQENKQMKEKKIIRKQDKGFYER